MSLRCMQQNLRQLGHLPLLIGLMTLLLGLLLEAFGRGPGWIFALAGGGMLALVLLLAARDGGRPCH